MKKISVLVCSAAVLLASCGSPKMGKVVMETAVDSVSYTMGMSRSNGFLPYLINQMGVDTAYIEDFIKGFIEGANMDADAGAQKAYFAGINIEGMLTLSNSEGLTPRLFEKEYQGHKTPKDRLDKAWIIDYTADMKNGAVEFYFKIME